MKEKILVSRDDNDKKAKEKLALTYLLKYIKELQVHFNLSDDSLRQVVYRTLSTIKCKNSINKVIDMIKSFW